jgi:hypothetical protein
MKRISAIVLAVLLTISLCGCGANQMSGQYKVSRCYLQDWKSDPNDVGASLSYITVNGIDDNSISTMNFYLSDTSSMITGYIVSDAELNDYTRYKFRVLNIIGGIVNDDTSMFYLNYYPKDDEIEIEMSGEVVYWFSK